jgi:hypothetical protein
MKLNASMMDAAKVIMQNAMQQECEEMKLASDDELVVNLAIGLAKVATEAVAQAAEGRARARETAPREIEALSAGSLSDQCDLPVQATPGKRNRTNAAASMRSSCSTCPL